MEKQLVQNEAEKQPTKIHLGHLGVLLNILDIELYRIGYWKNYRDQDDAYIKLITEAAQANADMIQDEHVMQFLSGNPNLKHYFKDRAIYQELMIQDVASES